MAQEPNIGWQEGLGAHAALPDRPSTSGFTIHSADVDGNPQDYPVGPVNGPVRAAFEQWLRGRATRAVKEIERVDIEEGDKMRRAFLADLSAGSYNWDGRHARSARGDEAGLRYLFFLLLRSCDPDMTESLALHVLENTKPVTLVGNAIEWALGNSQAPAGAASQPGKKTSCPTTPETRASEPKTLD